jgi:hypothetical protein
MSLPAGKAPLPAGKAPLPAGKAPLLTLPLEVWDRVLFRSGLAPADVRAFLLSGRAAYRLVHGDEVGRPDEFNLVQHRALDFSAGAWPETYSGQGNLRCALINCISPPELPPRAAPDRLKAKAVLLALQRVGPPGEFARAAKYLSGWLVAAVLDRGVEVPPLWLRAVLERAEALELGKENNSEAKDFRGLWAYLGDERVFGRPPGGRVAECAISGGHLALLERLLESEPETYDGCSDWWRYPSSEGLIFAMELGDISSAAACMKHIDLGQVNRRDNWRYDLKSLVRGVLRRVLKNRSVESGKWFLRELGRNGVTAREVYTPLTDAIARSDKLPDDDFGMLCDLLSVFTDPGMTSIFWNIEEPRRGSERPGFTRCALAAGIPLPSRVILSAFRPPKRRRLGHKIDHKLALEILFETEVFMEGAAGDLAELVLAPPIHRGDFPVFLRELDELIGGADPAIDPAALFRATMGHVVPLKISDDMVVRVATAFSPYI